MGNNRGRGLTSYLDLHRWTRVWVCETCVLTLVLRRVHTPACSTADTGVGKRGGKDKGREEEEEEGREGGRH